MKRSDDQNRYEFPENTDEEDDPGNSKFAAKSYMDSFVNPPEKLAATLTCGRAAQARLSGLKVACSLMAMT